MYKKRGLNENNVTSEIFNLEKKAFLKSVLLVKMYTRYQYI